MVQLGFVYVISSESAAKGIFESFILSHNCFSLLNTKEYSSFHTICSHILCLFPGQKIDGADKEPVDKVNLKLIYSTNKLVSQGVRHVQTCISFLF